MNSGRAAAAAPSKQLHLRSDPSSSSLRRSSAAPPSPPSLVPAILGRHSSPRGSHQLPGGGSSGFLRLHPPCFSPLLLASLHPPRFSPLLLASLLSSLLLFSPPRFSSLSLLPLGFSPQRLSSSGLPSSLIFTVSAIPRGRGEHNTPSDVSRRPPAVGEVCSVQYHAMCVR